MNYNEDYNELDMQEEQMRMGNQWAKAKVIQMSEGKTPNRTTVIDEIDIGLINTTIFCVEDTWIHSDLF